MTVNTSEFIDNLLALKAQYEHFLTEAGSKASYYKEQIAHVNALLLDRILPSQAPDSIQAHLEPSEPLLVATASVDEALSLPAAKVSTKAAKSKPAAKVVSFNPDEAPGSRVSIPFLPAYTGLKKLEAIGQVMQEHAGQILHQDTIIELLFGKLNPAALKTERLRMKTALLQGVKKNLWKKAPKPSSYILKGVKAKASSPVVPLSEPAAKMEAKSKLTSAKSAASAKGKTPKTKAPAKTTAPKTKPAAPAKTGAPKTKPVVKASKASGKALGKAPGQSPRIILPMQPEFTGLSKIDAVLKVMEDNVGKPVHIEDIIERLFGKLSGAEAKAEKGRMKDVMNRGRDRKLWNKAAAPLSFIVGAAAGAASKAPAVKTASKTKTNAAKTVSKRKPINTRRRRGG